MGCDGGTIPKRKEIVKNKERQTKRQRVVSAPIAEKWKSCAICDWVLKKPIVAGHWGHIFCKECVLKFLIDHKTHQTLLSYDLVVEKAPALDSLHSTKDFKELKLKPITDEDQPSQASTSEDESIKADYVCPITGLQTNGKYKFVFSWNCGCVVSERALKEVPNDDKCLVCQVPYQEIDIVTLIPDAKELESNQCKFMVRKMRPHLVDKKSSKKKSSRNDDWGASTSSSQSN